MNLVLIIFRVIRPAVGFPGKQVQKHELEQHSMRSTRRVIGTFIIFQDNISFLCPAIIKQRQWIRQVSLLLQVKVSYAPSQRELIQIQALKTRNLV